MTLNTSTSTNLPIWLRNSQSLNHHRENRKHNMVIIRARRGLRDPPTILISELISQMWSSLITLISMRSLGHVGTNVIQMPFGCLYKKNGMLRKNGVFIFQNEGSGYIFIITLVWKLFSKEFLLQILILWPYHPFSIYKLSFQLFGPQSFSIDSKSNRIWAKSFSFRDISFLLESQDRAILHIGSWTLSVH